MWMSITRTHIDQIDSGTEAKKNEAAAQLRQKRQNPQQITEKQYEFLISGNEEGPTEIRNFRMTVDYDEQGVYSYMSIVYSRIFRLQESAM